MAPKRPLGLGKASKEKKRKQNEQPNRSAEEETKSSNNELLSVELNEEVDPNDELGQLRALWKTFQVSSEKNVLLLNGVVHECDRLLRNTNGEGESSKLPDFFHSIYALALAELGALQEKPKEINDFFDAAIDRVELGLVDYADSVSLLLIRSRILLLRILAQYLPELESDSKQEDKVNIEETLENALSDYEAAEAFSKKLKDYGSFDEQTFTILEMLDDILLSVDNFGKEVGEEIASDEEDEEEENGLVQLTSDHPLYNIQQSEKYDQWWRDHTITFLEIIEELTKGKEEHDLLALKRKVSKLVGESYLKEAEEPTNIFTTLAYDDDYDENAELDGLNKEGSNKIAKDLLQKALPYLEASQDKEEPDGWVLVAEAKISLANLYELESKEQEELYQEAESILKKANKVTNGKYIEILENLLDN